MNIQVAVFRVLMLCGDVVGYRRFGSPFCLRLHSEDGYWRFGGPYCLRLQFYFLYQRLGGPYCLRFHPEDGGSVVLRNSKFLSQHTVSQP